jgi:hypothetical protein
MAHNDQASSSRGGGGYSRPTNLNNKEAQPDPSPASSLFASCGLPPIEQAASFQAAPAIEAIKRLLSEPQSAFEPPPFLYRNPSRITIKVLCPFFPDIFHRVDRFFSI